MTFITLTQRHCTLSSPIDNQKSDKTIAVREFVYKINFNNISHSLKNNFIKVDSVKYKVEDGYYDFCSLYDKLFKPNGVKLKLDSSNLRITLLDSDKDIVIPKKLKEQLGLARVEKTNGVTVGKEEMDLSLFTNVNICLDQLSLFDNMFNGSSSKILRSVAAPKGSFGDIVNHQFSPQFKKLQSTHIHELDVSFKDNLGNSIDLQDFTLVLQVN
mgnify:CR=1 FL=1